MTDLHITIIIIALIAAIILVWRGRPARARRDAADGEEALVGRDPVAGPPAGEAAAAVADSLSLFAPARSSTYTDRFAEDAAPSAPAPAPVAPPKAQASRIVTLLVVARGNAPLAGVQVHEALHEAGLVYNPKRQMYQRALSNGAPEGLYTVANILKPGQLDPAQARQLSTTGLAMFMVLPGPVPAEDALDDMLGVAGALGTRLGAEIYDQRRQLLTAESVQALRLELQADFPALA